MPPPSVSCGRHWPFTPERVSEPPSWTKMRFSRDGWFTLYGPNGEDSGVARNVTCAFSGTSKPQGRKVVPGTDGIVTSLSPSGNVKNDPVIG